MSVYFLRNLKCKRIYKTRTIYPGTDIHYMKYWKFPIWIWIRLGCSLLQDPLGYDSTSFEVGRINSFARLNLISTSHSDKFLLIYYTNHSIRNLVEVKSERAFVSLVLLHHNVNHRCSHLITMTETVCNCCKNKVKIDRYFCLNSISWNILSVRFVKITLIHAYIDEKTEEITFTIG